MDAYGSGRRVTPNAPAHYWLVPGHLAGGEWPLRHLDWIETQGISVLFNLTERSYRDRRFLIHQLPVPEGHPPEMEQIMRFCDLVRRGLAEERRLYVHCHRGCGRTGTMMACYLVYRERCGAEDAIARIQALQPCSVETDAQEEAVREWAAMVGRG